ncbi:MAG: PKD domain-containing protein [Deltaproteobacteria bacterium]|nr:MAG: PKD domain-containing protein [Deltaproteobacteria bacterium]
MRRFICYLVFVSLILISPSLTINVRADEPTGKTGSEIVCDFDAKPARGFSPLRVTFQNLSTGKVRLWYWDFGDGHKSRERNPVHRYLNAGEYSASLTVKGATGICETVKIDHIKVMAKQ